MAGGWVEAMVGWGDCECYTGGYSDWEEAGWML